MADLNCFDTLEPFLVRLKVLAQAQAGDIVVLDDAGQWLLQPSSTVRSALRKLWAFVMQKPIQPQRSAFLKSAKETVRLLIKHCLLLMRTAPFLKAIDPGTGSLASSAVATLPPLEMAEFEFALQSLHTVATHLHGGLAGLITLKAHEPYASDLTWCSELTVMVVDAILQFLDQVYRRLGADYAARVLPFLPHHTSSPISALAAQMAAAATAAVIIPTATTSKATWAPPAALVGTAAKKAGALGSGAPQLATAAPTAAEAAAAANLPRNGSCSDLSASQLMGTSATKPPLPSPRDPPSRKH